MKYFTMKRVVAFLCALSVCIPALADVTGKVSPLGGNSGGGGSMTWPAAAGIPCYSGTSSWCTSYSASNPIPANYVSGSGSGVTLQTNGTNNASQTALNLQSGSAVDGITPTISNPSGGNAQLGVSVNPANLQSALVATNAQTYTPTLASGATNDWDPSGGSGIATVGLAYTTPNATGSTVDGVLAGSDKQQFKLCNSAALGSDAEYIILENQSSSDSTAANRLMGSGNAVLGPQQCVMLLYLAGSINRWQMGRVEDAGTPAFQPLSSAATMTPDCSFKLVTETASQSAFTVNAPTDCTPRNGQYLELDIVNFSTANAYTWNAAYVGNATVSLPSAGGASSKLDRFAFAWDAANSTWDLKAYALGR